MRKTTSANEVLVLPDTRALRIATRLGGGIVVGASDAAARGSRGVVGVLRRAAVSASASVDNHLADPVPAR
jgi:hypothetical protein